ncbi:MAG: L,D-transpeptidase [Anaerolineae bacterium]
MGKTKLSKAWAVLLLLSWSAAAVPQVRAFSPEGLKSALFSNDTSAAYLCTPQTLKRYPERCALFSPGAHQVRLEYYRAQLPNPLPSLPVEEMESPEGSVSAYTFAYVTKLPASSFAHPAEAEAGLPPKRTFYAGSNWVSVQGSTEHNGEVWYKINSGEFIHADHIAVASPSRFQGVRLREQPQYPFAWIVRNVVTSEEPGGPAVGTTLRRYERVTIFAEQPVGDELWYMIGPDQWIQQTNVGRVDVDPRPEGVSPGEKWIEVDTFEQTLAAYEGDRMVFATLVSSGLPATWTPDGLNRIWAKLPSTPMSSPDSEAKSPAWYYLEDVEWTQYFFEDYALHAAYWHDGFGFPKSHGCVNLAPLDAQWLFAWTSPTVPEDAPIVLSGERAGLGTWVWVHKSNPFTQMTAN